MIKPNNDTLAEMLEGTRDALEKAIGRIAKLEAEKADLANKVLIYAHRAEHSRAHLESLLATPAMVAAGIEACDGRLHARTVRRVWHAMNAKAPSALSASAPNEKRLRDALEFIRDGYDRSDINHVDFRVGAYQAAMDALGAK